MSRVPDVPDDVALHKRWRVQLTYLWRHRARVRLNAPQLFTELVQHRKLFDHDRRMPPLADKLAVKSFVAEMLGAEWVTPTLWSGVDLPATPPWPTPFVIKSRHGCNQNLFALSPTIDWAHCRRAARRWMLGSYGGWLDEWLYDAVPRGLLVEPYLGCGDHRPIDYKLYVFGGEVHAVQVHLERDTRHRWMIFDPDWRPLTRCSDHPRRPDSLSAMIAAAEVLGRGFDFVRVDFYEIADEPRFGEMTFYPGSGLDAFDPPALDAALGALWRDARARRLAGGDGCPAQHYAPLRTTLSSHPDLLRHG